MQGYSPLLPPFVASIFFFFLHVFCFLSCQARALVQGCNPLLLPFVSFFFFFFFFLFLHVFFFLSCQVRGLLQIYSPLLLVVLQGDASKMKQMLSEAADQADLMHMLNDQVSSLFRALI